MTIQEKFPSIRPSLNLDFANTKTLNPRVTFNRASTATYYDGKTVAKAEENLLLYSQEFDNASWSKFFAGGVTIDVTANAGVAPDGTTTADRITTTGGASALQLGPTLVSGVDYTISMWVKRAGASDQTFRLSINNGSTSAYSGNLTATDAWQRFSYTVTSVGTNNSAHRTGITRDSSNSAYDVLVWGAQLEQRSSVTAYTATTTQPITNYIPVLQTAAANVARFDHNPTTGESLGLLIEEQRTNLVPYSDTSGGLWTGGGDRVPGAATGLPGVFAVGASMARDASMVTFNYYQSLTPVAGTTYTFSVFVRFADGRDISAEFGAPTVENSTLNPFTLVANGAALSWAAFQKQHLGGGLWRLFYTLTTSDTNARGWGILIRPTHKAGLPRLYVTGYQIEIGAFPTSYIKTEASQVTRAADSAVMTGTNFSSWFRQDEGSFCAEFSVNELRQAMIFSSGGSGIGTQSNGNIQVGVYNTGDNNIPQAIVTTVGNPYKVALVHDSKEIGGYGYSRSFVSGKTSNYIVPTSTSLILGSQGTQRWLNGHIRKIAYYPLRLTNTQLQALTS